MTVFQEKTIKYLGLSPNPAARDVLFVQLSSPVDRLRSLSFDKLYLRKDPEVYILLFKAFLQDEDYWMQTKGLSKDWLMKMAVAAYPSNDPELHSAAVQTVLKYKIYGALPTVLLYLESEDKNRSLESRNILLQLAELFYNDLLTAPALERCNFDRQRDWFVQQLNTPIKRYSVTGFDELLQSLLIITKKDFETMKPLMADHRSAASKKICDLLQNGKHKSYIRLLLSYVDDPDSPAMIDEILMRRSDSVYVRKLLEVVGTGPSDELKENLKRFNGFVWLTPANKELPGLVEGIEPCAIQLLQCCSIPKNLKIPLYRFFFDSPSFESRRAAAESIKLMVGEEVELLLLKYLNNDDPQTAAAIFRLLKTREVKAVDSFFEELVNRPEPEIRQAIYDTSPDLHAEVFAGRISQMTSEGAKKAGRYVRLVDPNTFDVIENNILSPILIRRLSACQVAAATGFAKNFTKRLIELSENDDELNVRCAAMSALTTVLTPEVAATLKNIMINDKSSFIRDTAATALRDWVEAYKAAYSNLS